MKTLSQLTSAPSPNKLKICRSKALAFTLAEVLITLGIIGVIAALTIPALMNQTNDKETVVALKKAHSTLSQAYTMAVQENGTPDTWGTGKITDLETGANMMMNTFAPYLKITKNCGTTQSGCFPNVNYKYLSNTGGNWGNLSGANNWIAKAQLADGSLLSVVSKGCEDSNSCGYFAVDINGFKSPNQLGVDYFFFRITPSKGIRPFGTANQTGDESFDTNCKDKTAAINGSNCAAWVIYNENLDYIKCPGTLSWNGPTKCN